MPLPFRRRALYHLARAAACILALAVACACGSTSAPHECAPPRLLRAVNLGTVSDTEPVDLDGLASPEERAMPALLAPAADGRPRLRLLISSDAHERRLVLHDLGHEDGGGPCYAVHGVEDGEPLPHLGVVRVTPDGRWLAVPIAAGEEHEILLAERDGVAYRVRARTSSRWGYADWPAIDPSTGRVAFWAVGGRSIGSVVVVTEPRGDELAVVATLGRSMVKHWPTFASNGRLAFRSLVDAEARVERVTADGVAQRDYQRVGNPRFDASGAHLVYAARRDGKEFLVIDGREWGPFDQVGSPRFVGEHAVGCVVRDGRSASWIVVR